MELPIPIIDLSGDHSENAARLRHACTEHGFFFGEKYYPCIELLQQNLLKLSTATSYEAMENMMDIVTN